MIFLPEIYDKFYIRQHRRESWTLNTKKKKKNSRLELYTFMTTNINI